jgi:hypothetical protein
MTQQKPCDAGAQRLPRAPARVAAAKLYRLTRLSGAPHRRAISVLRQARLSLSVSRGNRNSLHGGWNLLEHPLGEILVAKVSGKLLQLKP